MIAFVAETVGGATAGVLTPVPGYFKAVREVCDRHGCLLILDEVMCGMGRTGTLHACEQDGVVPDLLVIAKGLGGGYQPIGAVLAQERIVDAMARGSGFFQHGHTYLGHPVACAAALAVQKRDRARRAARPRPRARGGARWRGSARGSAAIRMSATSAAAGCSAGSSWCATGRPRRRSTRRSQLHARVKREAMARGLMTYPMGGTVDGRQGDHVLLAPPFIVDEAHLDLIVERLHAAIDAAIATV